MSGHRARFALALLSIVPAAALADAPHAERMKTGAAISIAAYAKQNPQCAEWTNGCVICAVVEGHARCSTPGIACTPAGLTCKRRFSP